MSVPIRLRKVRNTSSNTKFKVEEACIELVKHTFICCDSVDNKYPESKKISDKLRDTVLYIYECLNKANSVPFQKNNITEANYIKRTNLIKEALETCNIFTGYLNLGKVIYKWRNTKLDYWNGLVENVFSLSNDWLNWCDKEFLG